MLLRSGVGTDTLMPQHHIPYSVLLKCLVDLGPQNQTSWEVRPLADWCCTAIQTKAMMPVTLVLKPAVLGTAGEGAGVVPEGQ